MAGSTLRPLTSSTGGPRSRQTSDNPLPPTGRAAPRPIDVAIVGGGPSATYALDRLVAALTAAHESLDTGRPDRRGNRSAGQNARQQAIRTLAVFEPSGHFGGGRVYAPDQPAHHLMNRNACDIALRGPVLRPIEDVARPPIPASFLAWQACEPRDEPPVADEDAPPRAMVGRAFAAVFAAQVRVLRSHFGIEVHTIPAPVTAITEMADGSSRLALAVGGDAAPRFAARRVLLATGHDWLSPDAAQIERSAFALARPQVAYARSPCRPDHWPPDTGSFYTAPTREAGGADGRRVAVDGLGLTAIDAVLQLTEGRGGRFVRRDDGRGRDISLVYRASGREPPQIVLFGRSGLLTTARPVNGRMARGLGSRHPALLTTARVDALRAAFGRPARIAGHGTILQLDFDRDLLPAIVAEMALVFHATGREVAFHDALAEAWRSILDAAQGAVSRATIEAEALGDRRREDPWRQVDQIAARLETAATDLGSKRRFDWRSTLLGWPAPHVAARPSAAGSPPARARKGWHATALTLAHRDVARAQRGNLDDPHKAALDAVWRDARPVLGAAIDFGGLTSASEARFRRFWLPIYHRQSNGAPIAAMQKMIALGEAGRLDLSAGPDAFARPDPGGRGWLVEGSSTQAPVLAESLIEARVERFDPNRSQSPLYRTMLEQGLLALFDDNESTAARRNTRFDDPGPNTRERPERRFAPIAIDRHHRAIGRNGKIDPRILLVGTPIEGARYFQESLARPGAINATIEALDAWASEILGQDNDTASVVPVQKE